MKRAVTIIFLVILVGFGCKQDETPEVFYPEIAFVSISHDDVVEFDNDVAITFSYFDGDGDIGYDDPDAHSLKIKDSRLQDFDWFHIPPLTPDNLPLEIEGEFTVNLPPLFLLGNGGNESTSFTFQLQDRTGNWSNQFVTPEILIRDSL